MLLRVALDVDFVLNSEFVLGLDRPAARCDRRNPELLLFQLSRAPVSAVLLADRHRYWTSLSTNSQLALRLPLVLREFLHLIGVEAYLRKLFAVQHLGAKRGLLDLGAVFLGDV